MRPNFHDDPDARQKTEAFDVGMRVKVISPMVDFYAFRGETGTVESNSGGYLGITVRFDEPRRFMNGHVQEWFNFNYYDLELLLAPVDADEYARVCAEADDLRGQLAEVQRNPPIRAILDLWLDIATQAEYRMIREWLEACGEKTLPQEE